MKRASIILAWALFILAASGQELSGAEPPGTTATSSIKAPPIVMAVDLHAAYTDNEIAADLRFKGNTIIIEGYISEIGRTRKGEAYLRLCTPTMPVYCLFAKTEERSLAKLKRTDIVWIVAVVSGRHVVAETVSGPPEEIGRKKFAINAYDSRLLSFASTKAEPEVWIFEGYNIFHKPQTDITRLCPRLRPLSGKRYVKTIRGMALSRGCSPCDFCERSSPSRIRRVSPVIFNPVRLRDRHPPAY